MNTYTENGKVVIELAGVRMMTPDEARSYAEDLISMANLAEEKHE